MFYGSALVPQPEMGNTSGQTGGKPMPGPPRTPTHLKLLRGNPGHQKLRPEPEPLVPKTCPEPPPFITGYAADEWWKTAPELHRLGLLTRIDVPALAAYCHAFGQWRMAAEALAKMQTNDPIMNGMIIKTKYGDAAMNPMVSIVRKHASDVVRYASEFGLTALARSRLAAGTNAPPPGGGKFDGLLG
ncbi:MULTISPECIES: phage terminase small subunit P27 family [Bradyrhizobium]|uniref:phage terminase small subunit P27 family n=1 Tax=Bradyrhizobium TaxID=374 RepID=UPI0012FE156C|nr:MULTISPECIES: phage terminase small subunit P27 family [Bradyrhizobium]MDI2074029.1 phage terminase small subunit P27 family [Bradyrhizobium sp. Mp27]